MSDHPSLTVVILTYNSGDSIRAPLEALATQRHSDFEVMVVDDDSVDDTLSVVAEYLPRMKLSVLRNGAHNIPRGRNIGLDAAQTDIVAFADSDDYPTPEWTQVIVETFRQYPETVLLGGNLLPSWRSNVAHAIALNDHAIRRLFLGGVLQFCAGNSAVNIKALQGARFDEDFKAGEDLELASRVTGPKRYVPEMAVHHHSRETFRQYVKQMYRYGFMKAWFSYVAQDFRWLDFIPLALLVGGIAASAALQTWWPLLLNIPFALAEALFVVVYERCPLRVAALTFPAWLVKNLAWSAGITCGLAQLAVHRNLRVSARAKRAVRT